jgi:uncharacterized membrane protein YqiK
VEALIGLGIGALVGLVLGLPLLLWFFGFTGIAENEVGIVVKKFAMSSLPPGRIVAVNGEAGYQAETLPPGWHMFLWPWQYKIEKAPMVVIAQGQIALVVAADGTTIPGERILAKMVDCDDFQDAKKFLFNGGEQGRQLRILTAGTYRINTALFTVISQDNCKEHGMTPDQLRVFEVRNDMVGIVATMDGMPIDPGEIAGPSMEGHDNFQKAKAFMEKGGRRGLQEQVLLSGQWNLNPWFVKVEQVPMTEIPIGHVGVVISYVGKEHQDVSGANFKHGDLVNEGHKGVWVTPLQPGKHPVNTRVMKTELVPTTNIVLNWANRTEAHALDEKLESITVRSHDGFSFNLDVSQIIHVAAAEAPKVISRVGNMRNLVDHVLEPIIGNYFRNSAQDHTVLDFLNARSDRQKAATEHISAALALYNVEAIDTLIGDITPPAALMATQTDRKIAEEQKRTYETQEAAQKQRQLLVRETAQADIQNDVVKAEQGVKIAELQAAQQVKLAAGNAESAKVNAVGEAEAIRSVGWAKAEAYKVGVEALGASSFTAVQMVQMLSDKGLRVTPDVLVAGASGQGGLMDALLALIAKDTLKKQDA